MLGNVAEYVEIPGEPPGRQADRVRRELRRRSRRRHLQRAQSQTADWNSTDPQNPKSKWWLSDGPFVGFGSCASSETE
jgi:hypothetical protein